MLGYFLNLGNRRLNDLARALVEIFGESAQIQPKKFEWKKFFEIFYLQLAEKARWNDFDY